MSLFFHVLIRNGMYSVSNAFACMEIKAFIRALGFIHFFIHIAIILNITV